MNNNLSIAVLPLALALSLAGCSSSSDSADPIQDDADSTNAPAEIEETSDLGTPEVSDSIEDSEIVEDSETPVAPASTESSDTTEDPATPEISDTTDGSESVENPEIPTGPAAPVDPGTVTGTEGETDPADNATTIINDQSYTQILSRLLPLIDGTTTDSTADAVISVAYDRINNAEFEGTKPDGFTATGSSFDASSSTAFTEYDCDAGGSMVSSEMLARTVVVFDMCIVDNGIYNGSASADFQRDTTTYAFEDFTITASSGNTSLDGIIETRRFRSGSAFFDTQQQTDLSTAELSDVVLTDYTQTIGGRVDTSSLDSAQPDAIVTRTLSSRFTVNAEFTGGIESPMQVGTTTDFIGVQPDAFYVAGTLTATASDGSLLELNADNGDPGTFQVTVTAASVTTSYTLPWNETYRLRCIDQTNEATPSAVQYDCSN